MGIAPRRLWGWAPRTVTVHEYDESGRPSRSVTLTEPEFTPEQVSLLLALHELESVPTGSHGVPMAEATDLANQWRFRASYKTDWAQKSIDDAAEALQKQYPDGNPNGRVWSVELQP